MITIAGVVFSLTLIALSLASQQFGSRLLRNFMRDKTNQVVIGTFVATFLYCLLVLRTIRRDDEIFVPHLSVTFGVLLAVASVGLLIYFIHHVSVSIQADEIIARVNSELTHVIDRLFPEQIGQGASRVREEDNNGTLPEGFDREARPVEADGDGYLQIIDTDELMALAGKDDLILRVERHPGQYIAAGTPLVSIWPSHRVDNRLIERIHSAFVLDIQRTPEQDVEYAVYQLVQMAVRALSPGINDPFTAMTCLDRLGSSLTRLAQREMPSSRRYDDHHKLRIIAPVATFSQVVDAAFNQIRQYGRTSAAVNIHMLETIRAIAEAIRCPEDRVVLRRHAEMVLRNAVEALPEEEDRRAVEDCYQEARRCLRKAGTVQETYAKSFPDDS
jgi:uncharacterized membrane protein